MVELSVVVPVYNEKNVVGITLTKISSFLNEYEPDYEIIVVDDGSEDTTREIVESIQKVNNKVVLIKNPHKGKGYSVRTGVLKANGRYILMTDVDLAAPIEELKRLMVWIKDNNFDVAIGSREGVGAQRKNEPWIRHFMGRVFNHLVQILVLPGINDTQCGFKLFKEEPAKKAFSASLLYGDKTTEIKVPKVTAFDVEILFLIRRLGYKIKEIPITWEYGRSTKVSNIRDSFVNFFDVLKVKYNDIKGLYKV